jgi:hypothetical protein
MSILSVPPERGTFMRGKAESHQSGFVLLEGRRHAPRLSPLGSFMHVGLDSSRSSQAVRARRTHADTLPRPVRDEASQGYSFSRNAGRVAEREGFLQTHCQPVCDEASQGSTASAETQARWPSGAA